MASRVIGRLPVVYNPATRRVEVESAGEFVETQLFQRLDELAKDKPLRLTLTVEPEHHKRSTAQNSLMWALLTIMADHYNGGRTGGVTPEDCYLEMLEKYGAKVDYLEVPAGALDILRGCYRIVHVVEILDNNRCTVKCTQGSSTFTTGEMKALIDGIFDRLAEMGVNDPVVTAYWQEWRRIDYAARKDVINAQKRAAYAAQAYRKDRGAVSEISLIRRSEEVKLSVRQVDSYKTPVYVSDQATIKPKALHRINQNTEKALSDWGVSLDRKPKIIVVGDNELRGAVGIYDPCENVVYYAESVGKKTVQDASGGFGVIEAHEMWHMKQAEDFRQSGWVITRENRAEYLDALCKKCKGRIDKLGITRDNVRELSQYAADMYLGERFDEVEAEFMSLRRRK